ncbi:TetR/AcrR family transcriptional regulator [Actinomadura barringtoniae]|uniref:TetR/AcrR family transcriptional regulator n=1 Tax=Actinomadura barringtoniae TaxID=1427535 RepID=A0A939T823_9ACTN|nr:TetR family transcriptional regulator [Actinomadura barringtoniae]MBO2446455.1 TetR/AcrR family transcriptional regulator [Actinomadura barringtoniae]
MAHVPAAERRPQLVQAAIELMAREGLEAGSTRAIAAELGVAQATVHYTFGSKRDLYRAVMEQMTADLVDQVCAAAPENLDFESSLRVMAEALWEGMRKQPGRYVLYVELATHAYRNPEMLDVIAAHQKHMHETAAALINELAEQTGRSLRIEATAIARFFLAGFDGLAQNHLTAGETHAAADLQRLVEATVALA